MTMTPDPKWSATRPMVWGAVGCAILVLGPGVWAATASISGAVISVGHIEVEANRQVVQHPDGGVVGEILVKDGDRVEAGQVLIRFDETLLRSELNIIEGQLYEIIARRGRLSAERDQADRIAFDQEILNLAATRPDVQALIDGQESLFRARADTRAREVSQLRERQIQTEQQVTGGEAQLASVKIQLELIRKELGTAEGLLAKGLIEATRVLSLLREEARLDGQVGELISTIAQSRGRIAEIEIEVLKTETTVIEEAITTARDLDYRENELRERQISTIERLSRLEVRAPVKGIVYGMVVHAVRSVVRAADAILYIVPVESDLVITTRVEPINIDQVHVGQEAVLRFSAFNAQNTPEIRGLVTQVSADAYTDEQRGISYYTARVLPKPGEIEKLGDKELLPGMPVEAFIQTGERSALSYFVKPLTDYFNKAMREE